MTIPFYSALMILTLSCISVSARPQSSLISAPPLVGSGTQRLEEISVTVAKALYKDEEEVFETNNLGVVIDEEGRKFIRIKVKDDGGCFAYAVGTTRDAIITTLEYFIDSTQISSTENLSMQLLSLFSPVFSFIHKHPSIRTFGDLKSLLSYDFPTLKDQIKKLSTSTGKKELELKFTDLEKIIAETQTDFENLKKQKGILSSAALSENFSPFEKCLEELKIDLKATFPHTYNLFNYRKFLSILAVALSKKPLIQKFVKEVSAIKRDLEKGIFKQDGFSIVKKLARAAYGKNQEIMIENSLIPSQNSWFDLELLPILEDGLSLNCVVIIDKSTEEDERRNKIQTKTSRPFNTEPRYIYYTNRNHFDVLVPLVPLKPFPSPPKKTSQANQ